MLGYILLEQVLGHAQRPALRIERLLFEVIAVAAVQIADRPDRLDEYLKFRRRCDQCDSPVFSRSVLAGEPIYRRCE